MKLKSTAKEITFHPSGYPYDIQVNFTFVEYGYQLDIINDGTKVVSYCRDFGGDYSIPDIKIAAISLLSRLGQQLEKTIKKPFKSIIP